MSGKVSHMQLSHLSHASDTYFVVASLRHQQNIYIDECKLDLIFMPIDEDQKTNLLISMAERILNHDSMNHQTSQLFWTSSTKIFP